jgi:hypothetical protein
MDAVKSKTPTTLAFTMALLVSLQLALAGVHDAGAQVSTRIDQPSKPCADAYATDPETLKAIATGGAPMGRWKEGLTFDGVESSGRQESRRGLTSTTS